MSKAAIHVCQAAALWHVLLGATVAYCMLCCCRAISLLELAGASVCQIKSQTATPRLVCCLFEEAIARKQYDPGVTTDLRGYNGAAVPLKVCNDLLCCLQVTIGHDDFRSSLRCEPVAGGLPNTLPTTCSPGS